MMIEDTQQMKMKEAYWPIGFALYWPEVAYYYMVSTSKAGMKATDWKACA